MNLQEFMAAQERLKTDRPALEQIVNQGQGRLKSIELAKEALDGLRRCWKDEDPGKYGDHWFLAKDYSLAAPDPDVRSPRITKVEKFWAIEIIDDAVEAQRGRKSRWSSDATERYPVPLGKLADAKQEACPHCQKLTTVVGCYGQTEDSPEGDTWMMELFTLCLACVALESLASRVESGRFA